MSAIKNRLLGSLSEAKKLYGLQQNCMDCQGCDAIPIAEPVPPTIPDVCDILFIGQNPGNEEYEQGKPFVGKSGKMVRACVQDSGIDPKTCGYTNMAACPTNGNSKPSAKMLAACEKHVLLDIIRACPKRIVVFGEASKNLFIPGKENSVSSMTYRLFDAEDLGIQIAYFYHPSYLLYNGSDAGYSEKNKVFWCTHQGNEGYVWQATLVKYLKKPLPNKKLTSKEIFRFLKHNVKEMT